LSSIRTAIYSHFMSDNTAALYTDLSGDRFYYSEAVEQETKPYCVYQVFEEIYDFMFVEEFEEALIQFSYYGDTAAVVDDGISDIKTMFDYAELTVSGYTCLRMQREYIWHPTKIMPDDHWEAHARYSLLIKKD